MHSSQIFRTALTYIINQIYREAIITKEAKAGYKIPISKRGKDHLQLPTYRDIVITTIICKLIEHIIIDLAGSKFDIITHISNLQFGFSKD